MSQQVHRCKWCLVEFNDAATLENHERVHRDLDFLNSNFDGPPASKKKFGPEIINQNEGNFFSDSMLNEMMNYGQSENVFDDDFTTWLDELSSTPTSTIQSGGGPEDQQTTRPPPLPQSPPPPARAPGSPVPGPSHAQDDVAEDRALDYDFRQVGQRTFKNSVVDRHFRVNLRPNQTSQGKKLSDLHREMQDMFDEIIDAARHGLQGNDLGRVILHHNGLINPIFISLRPMDRLSGRSVMDQVEAVLNSHQDLKMNDSFYVDVGTMELPKGGKGNGLPINTLSGSNSTIKRKKSIVEIVNDDQTCMARAIAMAYLAAISVTTEEWHDLDSGEDAPMEKRVLDIGKCPRWYFRDLKLEKHAHRQTALMIELCRRANAPTNRSLTLMDVSAFEDVLDVDILVIASRACNKFVRVPEERGEEEEEEEVGPTTRNRLYLYLVETNHESHFHAIVNICGFFGQTKFCSRCLKAYQGLHQCASNCFVCKRKEGCILDGLCQMSCRSCHMTCRSRACFESHRSAQRVKESPCQRWWKCTICKKVVDRKKRNPSDHFCGEWHCQCCGRYVDREHRCYVRALENIDSQPRFIFFDFECTQDDDIVQCAEGYVMQRNLNCEKCKDDAACSKCSLCIHCGRSWCGKFQHVPNLVVAHKVCQKCIDLDFESESKCESCGTRCPKCNKYDKRRNASK